MSCMVAPLAGGDPAREIFPISEARMDAFKATAAAELAPLVPAAGKTVFVGTALKPDGSPFYVYVLAPEFVADPTGSLQAGFFASFGVADVVGTLTITLGAVKEMPATMAVSARALLDDGGNPQVPKVGRTEYTSANWEVLGNQATRPNKSSLLGAVTVTRSGPHSAEDIRRCIALHAPQRCFGEPRVIAAMQCGVAAAALLEAIC